VREKVYSSSIGGLFLNGWHLFHDGQCWASE